MQFHRHILRQKSRGCIFRSLFKFSKVQYIFKRKLSEESKLDSNKRVANEQIKKDANEKIKRDSNESI